MSSQALLGSEIIKIKRSSDNARKRPNGQDRHDPYKNYTNGNTGLDFISPTDLEWMSLNYRKERAAKVSESKRRMILVMF